jgi:hypothetical protein
MDDKTCKIMGYTSAYTFCVVKPQLISLGPVEGALPMCHQFQVGYFYMYGA